MSSLLKSRKFWLTIFTVAGLLAALLGKQIDGKTFAEAATAAVMLLVAAIAHEDHAQKGVDAASASIKAMTDLIAGAKTDVGDAPSKPEVQ